MAKKIWVKDAGAWRLVTDLKVHDGTQFRNVTAAYVRASGAWKQVYLDKRALTITAETTAYNVAAQLGNPSYAVEVDLTINAGVVVGSTLTTAPAIDCSGLVAGSVVNIYNNGTIVGKGGNGGNGGTWKLWVGGYGCVEPTLETSAADMAGKAGGNALKLGSGVIANITNASGYIYGGGGGGGGGGGAAGGNSSQINQNWSPGSGGGGGAGYGTTVGGSAGTWLREGTVGGTPKGCNSYSGPLDWTCAVCPGNAGANGGTSGGAGGSEWGNWHYNCHYQSGWLHRTKGGSGGNGGDYGAAGGAGGVGQVGYVSGPWCQGAGAGGTAGAAGKAIDLAGGTVNWISGNDSTHVKGAVA